MALRFDRAKLSKTSRTPQGFLRAPAAFTRTGVFVYEKADGTKIRELRPADEVFNSDSLLTLSGAPVAKDHPAEGLINPANAKRFAIGWGSELVAREDDKVTGSVTIMDQDAIAEIEAGTLAEVSLGYQCRIDRTPGVDPVHGPYDQVQRAIRYNHIALGPAAWGRAGSEVGLRLDSEAAIIDPLAEKSSSAVRTDHQPEGVTMKVKIAGIEFDIPDQAAQALAAERSAQERKDSDVAKLISEHEALQGRFDAAVVELGKVKEKLAEAESPARLDSRVAGRVALVAKARRILGATAECKGTDREIMESALKKAGADVTGKSDDYVSARFDAITDSTSLKALGESRRVAELGAGHSDTPAGGAEPRYDSNTARKKMLQRNAEAWQKPLTISTQK